MNRQCFKCQKLLSVRLVIVAALSGLFLSSAALPAALPGDEHWDNQFGPVGANDTLQAVAAIGRNIYIGGYLLAAGNTRAGYVAAYDGTNWSSLNKGLSSDFVIYSVYSLTTEGTNLYAGGWFSDADNVGARYIARWDGSRWFPVGNPMNGPVLLVKSIGSSLYAGGLFSTNSGVALNGVARWDGAHWLPLGEGVAGGSFPSVSALASDGESLYAGGMFTSAGGVSAQYVARWDGASWSALASGLNGPVNALTLHGGSLYAGGAFTNAALTITNLARWDGDNWVAVGLGANRAVRDLISDGSNLYAGGNFTRINGVAAVGIARWNGTAWSSLGSGLGGFGIGNMPLGAYKLALHDNRLYVAGVFNQAGGVGVSHVAGWDGTNWFSLGGRTSKGLTHFIGNVQSFLPAGTNLYVGGAFTEAGDSVVNSIAQWNGSNWSTLGSGLTGTFTSGVVPNGRGLALIGNDLYVGGNFTNAGGVAAKGMARWDGHAWSPLGSGTDATVRSLAVRGSELFVGGSFTNAGGVLSPGIALWTGFGWLPLGGVSGGNRVVNVVMASATNIYIGGNFTSVGAVSALNIARWNGLQWSALGGGVNGTVSSLAIRGSDVYAGGTFLFADSALVNRVARWDGVGWSALGSGVSGEIASPSVTALAIHSNDLYVGGNFTNAGGVYATGLAKWDGASWSTLGSGLTTSPGTPTTSALAFVGNDLFVGGGFTYAGDKPSMYIARWNDQINFYPPPQPRLVDPTWLTNGAFRFRLSGTSGERYTIEGSTNVNTWTPLLTNSATLYDFTDPAATHHPNRAYRAVVWP